MSDVVIILKQQGIIRAAGYQVTQWFVTAPLTFGAPVTSPPTFAPLFLVRNVLGRESFERVCSLTDIEAYPEDECIYFEARSSEGGAMLAGAAVGMTLSITGNGLLYWEQTDAPYNNRLFTVNAIETQSTGTLPVILTGNRLQLPGHTFTDSDIGRWVYLNGFTTTSYNGYTQILSFDGGTAIINKPTSSPEIAGTWAFKRIQIKADLGVSAYEPRYFPTVTSNAPWTLLDGATVIASGTNGGVTSRFDAEATLVRTARFTQLFPTQDGALAFMSAIRTIVADVQRSASISGGSFTAIIETVFGP